jgi:hypothetical protein
LTFIFLLLSLTAVCEKNQEPLYSVPESPWPESFGNHRAVIEISGKTDVAILDILWRRHDPDPQRRRFIIVDASTGDTVPNILRFEVNNERCKIAFGPVIKPGIYYFYYLPYEVQENWGFYGKDYLPLENDPSGEWVLGNHLSGSSALKSFATAKLKGFQSRTAFDSFFPMEVIALPAEKKSLTDKFTDDYLIFPEERLFPIRMRDEIPLRWIRKGPSGDFSGEACRNEYFAFQIGLYASRNNLSDIKCEFGDLGNGGYKIPASALTCFNTGGIGPYGEPFEKRVDVSKGSVQPLWIGVDIPGDIPAGTYSGRITLKCDNAAPETLKIVIKVADKYLADRGDSEPWRHSRLRWLNSTLGIDDNPVKPYKPIEHR